MAHADDSNSNSNSNSNSTQAAVDGGGSTLCEPLVLERDVSSSLASLSYAASVVETLEADASVVEFHKDDNDETTQMARKNNDDSTWAAGFSKSLSVAAEEWKDTPLSAVGLLNLVAIIWGSQHAVIKMVVDDTDPSVFNFLRFAIATLLVVPYTPSLEFVGPSCQEWIQRQSFSAAAEQDDGSSQQQAELSWMEKSALYNDGEAQTAVANAQMAWRWGLEMGLWMFLGYAFQAVGLESTTAQRSGFLLYLNVKFVPFFAWALMGRQIRWGTWISALTAFVGTALLAMAGGGAGGDQGGVPLNVGDAWSVAAAAASAMFILRLESASHAVGDSSALNAASLWIVTLLSLLWSLGTLPHDAAGSLSALSLWGSQLWETVQLHPWEVLYLSGVTTALTNYLQTKAQKQVSAERASVLYAMDPVYGAAFAHVLLGESLGGTTGMVGATLITLAAASSALVDNRHHNDDDENHPHGNDCREKE